MNLLSDFLVTRNIKLLLNAKISRTFAYGLLLASSCNLSIIRLDDTESNNLFQ